jgi:prephenate dehydrogenase
MNNSVHSVGIIGLGPFGKLCASLIPSGISVKGFDSNADVGFEISKLEDVCKTDVVILAVPLGSYPTVLNSIQGLLAPTTLLVDICSVKVKPAALIAEHLPDHTNVLFTHPLFGPQTIENGTEGHSLIVCNTADEKSQKLIAYSRDSLKLKIVTMTPEEHDKEMALVHALTLFIARGLSEVHAEESQFATPSFTYIKKLIELDRAHSEELFTTIENGNPYAKEIRQKILRQLVSIDTALGNEPA